ncbi:MAG TPA: hypothetical protein VHI74_00155 [Methyloceanibacter sp.]|jgi:hypothetical protein|nr:hypothetical protein [Methyloceanibacter sp.]
MHLIQLMNHVPLWLVGLIVMIAAQTYAIGLMLLTRAIYGVSRLAENNEVAGLQIRRGRRVLCGAARLRGGGRVGRVAQH